MGISKKEEIQKEYSKVLDEVVKDAEIKGFRKGKAPQNLVKKNVEKIVEWCRKGPEYARVSGVEVIPEQYRGEFSGFLLRR